MTGTATATDLRTGPITRLGRTSTRTEAISIAGKAIAPANRIGIQVDRNAGIMTDQCAAKIGRIEPLAHRLLWREKGACYGIDKSVPIIVCGRWAGS